MESAPEELVGSNNDQSHLIVKGKRTKRRHRPSSPSPPPLAAVTSSSASSAGGGEEYASLWSPTTTTSSGGGGGEIYESTTEEEEEEDMANCLILLAQGDHAHAPKQTRKLKEIAVSSTTAANKPGFFVYECKTCNRTFPSFQALGGHRASHKKPRAAMVEEKKASPPVTSNIITASSYYSSMADEYEQVLVFNKVTTTPPPTNSQLPRQIANAKALIQSNKAAKIHQCSVCGSEFTSGQALGGHMRRHRASSNAQSFEVGTSSTGTRTSMDVDEMKHRNILALDLNLPAPEDDHRESKFPFVPTQQALVFSSPTLVDCHY